MLRMPLYSTSTPSDVFGQEPLNVDAGCQRCALSTGVQHPCIPPDGDATPGGLLVLGESPTREDDMIGHPFTGSGGKLVRGLVARYWKGTAVYDYAVKCWAGNRSEAVLKALPSCAAYVRAVLDEVQPSRIIAIGNASHALVGRGLNAFELRKPWTWLHGAWWAPHGVPVFSVLPVARTHNKFIKAWFEEDFVHALTSDVENPLYGNVNVIESEVESATVCAKLRKAGTVVIDVETSGAMYSSSFAIEAIGVAAADDDGEVYVWVNEDIYSEALRALLCDPTVKKVAHNAKFDTQAIGFGLRMQPRGFVHDTRLMWKLLRADAHADLERLAELVGMGGHKHEMADEKARAVKQVNEVFRAEAKNAKRLEAGKPGIEVPTLTEVGVPTRLHAMIRASLTEEIPSDAWVYAIANQDIIQRYVARDVASTARLYNHLTSQLAPTPMGAVYTRLVSPASESIAKVERWGIKVDRSRVRIFDHILKLREEKALTELNTYAPGINWDSPKQVGELLYGRLKLKAPYTTDSGAPSTDAEALATLEDKHPVPKALLEFRKWTKLRRTYAHGMLTHVRDDGRIHPSILLDGAGTGRTSCVAPNLQNIPRPTSEEGKMARDCFVASQGCTLVQFDYKQLELVVAAILSGDDVMADIFRSGTDYHMRTAQLISKLAWGIEPSQVDKTHRTAAKAFNFGLLYGKTNETLARDLGIKVVQAARIREAIFGQFKGLAKWCRDRLFETRAEGVAWTAWDGKRARVRPLLGIADSQDGVRQNAENSAVNTPVQGTASDYCISSLDACVRWLVEERVPAKLILPVHDSLLFDVRNDAVEEVLHVVPRIMCDWPSNGVPLSVDAEMGESWGSLKKVEGI